MPSCRECRWLKGEVCTAYAVAQETLKRPLPPPPLGACAIPIVRAYLEKIGKGHRVLEIGCGSWSEIKDHCERVGAHYDGIDTEKEYYGEPTVATRVENLSSLSFENETFDFVIGNQTMEHWGEHGCSLRWGLYQCFRVCKPGGSVFMNVPIHFHGTREFTLGEMKKLAKAFAVFSRNVDWESWGKPSAPFPPYISHPGYRRLENHPAYVLDIRAVKDLPTPRVRRPLLEWKGRWAQLVRYPVTFNLHRVALRLRPKPSLRAEP